MVVGEMWKINKSTGGRSGVEFSSPSRYKAISVGNQEYNSNFFLAVREESGPWEVELIKRDRFEGDSVGGQVPSSGDGGDSDKQRTRMNKILTALQQTGSVSVEELSKQLRVTVVTVRRDLDALEAQGRLRRTHGGAVSIAPLFYEPFRNRSEERRVGEECRSR